MDVIKDNLQLQWNANAIIIKTLPYFKHLNTTELNKCSTVSFIKTFTQNDYYVLGKYNTNHKSLKIVMEFIKHT